VRTRPTKLRQLAGGLIAASVGAGVLAVGVRAGWGGSFARALEGATLFLAAAAYLAHVFAHHDNPRELLTRSILAIAFALWGMVQIARAPWQRAPERCRDRPLRFRPRDPRQPMDLRSDNERCA
jgi:hypothetical protein